MQPFPILTLCRRAWVFVPSSCVAYLLKGTCVACRTLSVPTSFVGLRRAFEVKYVAACLVRHSVDYFGAHVLIVFLDAVHEVNVGFLPTESLTFGCLINDACLYACFATHHWVQSLHDVQSH